MADYTTTFSEYDGYIIENSEGREMMNFLEKLNRKAEGMVSEMDNQLKAPIARLMTGEIFSDALSNEEAEKQKRKASQTDLPKNR